MTKKKKSYATIFTLPSLTKQSESDNSDINTIMARYQSSGIMPQINKKTPQYGDFSKVKTYQEALLQINEANNQFNSLPAHIRNQFENNPAKFLEFTNNPDNENKMREMGLLPPLDVVKNDESNDEKPLKEELTAEQKTNLAESQ